MARKVEVQLLDDIDGTKADETLKFGLDGTLYEVDLNTKHAEQLRKSLAAYVLKARRIGRGGVTAIRDRTTRAASATTRSDRVQNQAIREWAKSKGLEVSERGRIPASVVEKYEAEAGR
jgi:hypothetical protein